ncbi:CHAT domain-containing protein [Gymnopilus junonius]|uniref:CHAT domain-containing protein n=1 Tax=Gymnopilus junonius TaxID=109634 RepID=A0A9P5TNL0_GYMJU|nr:CHAT domain-containing protein [Gymnopilus junonius]
MLRFERTGQLSDISDAISMQQRAVQLTPSTNGAQSSLSLRLNSLGNSLTRDSENMAYRLNSLGNSLMRRFEHTGTWDNSNLMSARLDNLGVSLMLRFVREGDLEDISESISIHRRAVDLTPEGHPNLPAVLHHLGGSLRIRFLHTQQLTDISESISVQQKAVQLTPEHHAYLPGRLDSSGSSLMRRFDITGHVTDISEAIATQKRALLLTPAGNTRLPSRMNNLALSLRSRFKQTGNLDDISEAINLQRRAGHLSPESHADLPTWLNNLGVSLQTRFGHTTDLADISEAISVQRRAIQLTPEGHAYLSSCLNNLGNSLFSRFEHSTFERYADIQNALASYRRSATSPSGPLSARLWGAQRWAKLSNQVEPSQSLEAWPTVIRLASQVAGLEFTIQERYTFLLDVSELSASAAAAAFEHGRPDLALEWLEQGRCLVWGQLNTLRVSRALENAASRADPLPFTDETTISLAHVRLAQRWDQLLDKPLSYSTLLQHLPKSGFVVFVNAHTDRCDALILISRDKTHLHIPLPDFSYQKAGNLRNALATHLHQNGLRMRGSEVDIANRGMRYERTLKSSSVIKELLRQLWECVAKPILDGLGSASDSMVRIWWCATGPLAFLPIHAAGIYDGAESITVADYAISSYIPSVSVLAERVKSSRESNTSDVVGLLMISQPDTPGQLPIPGTTAEIRGIEQFLRDADVRHLCLEKAAATVDEGIKQMEAYSCVHFACHANQDTKEPLKSAFYLQDRPLELSAIIKQNLTQVDLAFLAACQTSTGDEKLSEEAVHLAAGMLAAGYRGVIATMWSISDLVAPKIAELFYAKIILMGSGESAARALHYATKEVRKELGDTEDGLLGWIPYVHFGM